MNFQHTWRQVLDGSKTQTRRLVKPGERGEVRSMWDYTFNRVPPGPYWRVYNGQRVKWQMGCNYAVQPGRGQYAIWYRRLDGNKVQIWNDHHQGFPSQIATHAESDDGLCRWQQLHIRITAIRQEPLQDISEEDAKDEGCRPSVKLGTGAIEQFSGIWNTIHATPGTRWADNPDVWVLEWEPNNA